VTDDAHDISVVVWDIPRPVVKDHPFTVKVGVACAAQCPLTGHRVAVHANAGAAPTFARLGDAPWPGTIGLYWAEVVLPGPATEGRHEGTVIFSGADDGGADAESGLHAATSVRFTCTAAGTPEHSVTMVAVDAASRTPVERVELRLGPYRATTDGRGTATIAVPSGSYDLVVWKPDFEAAPVSLTVSGDVAVEIEMRIVPKEDEPYWT
jgi:hypothetical protein